MRLKVGVITLLVGVALYFAPSAPVQAQVITAGPDSTIVPTPAVVYDSINERKWFFLHEWDKPAKAALFSAVVPGAGQFYNKSYWKIPIIYATAGVLTYFYIDNNNNYQDYKLAYAQRVDGDSTTIDQFANSTSLGTARGSDAIRNLKYRRDFWRRNRDLTIILSVAAWSLQVAEAYVHAHLKDFDVGDDLALHVRPTLVPIKSLPGSLTPGLTLTLYTRSK